MESHEYQTLFDFESSYWWYRSLHAVLVETLLSLGLNAESSVLDAGCGTGQNLANIQEQITTQACGFDLAPEAAPFWARRGLRRVCQASINDIPFSDRSFDAVVSVDVLECDAVDEDKACGELWRVVKDRGYLILVVPAYDWLMTPEHHKAVRATRRYSRAKLAALLQQRGMQVVRMTHLFGSLLPLVAAYRLGLRYFKGNAEGPPRSELKPMHPLINNSLIGVMSVERRLLRVGDIPFGSSILAVAQKV